jgi:hypothetical protein
LGSFTSAITYQSGSVNILIVLDTWYLQVNCVVRILDTGREKVIKLGHPVEMGYRLGCSRTGSPGQTTGCGQPVGGALLQF